MYLNRKLHKSILATLTVTASLVAAALTATSANAYSSINGQIGPYQITDPWVHCSRTVSVSPFATIFADTLTIKAPNVYAMSGYTQQQVGWDIRAFRIQSDGSLGYVSTVFGNGGYAAWATRTAPANLGQIYVADPNLFGSGHIKIAVDLFWFGSTGNWLGTFTTVYTNYYENINGTWHVQPYCQF